MLTEIGVKVFDHEKMLQYCGADVANRFKAALVSGEPCDLVSV